MPTSHITQSYKTKRSTRAVICLNSEPHLFHECCMFKSLHVTGVETLDVSPVHFPRDWHRAGAPLPRCQTCQIRHQTCTRLLTKERAGGGSLDLPCHHNHFRLFYLKDVSGLLRPGQRHLWGPQWWPLVHLWLWSPELWQVRIEMCSECDPRRILKT